MDNIIQGMIKVAEGVVKNGREKEGIGVEDEWLSLTKLRPIAEMNNALREELVQTRNLY
jgi:hypothetical protein